MQTILIVDDHPLYREGMMSALRAQMGDVEVLGADSAEDGLQVLVGNPDVDLVLIDVRLPGMDGFAALSVYGARFPTVSCMLVSGSEEPSYLKRAFEAGASGFIAKSMPVGQVTAAIRRVLGNLISNALRYTSAGSVHVRCEPKGERIAIAVADTGPGIPRDEHERVFDEFYQLGNPERDRRKGLGLGLATVKRIGQLLGCRVTLDSEPGQGSVFAIEVPRGDSAQIAYAPAAPSAADVDALRGKVIAVVDDERDVREGLAELLAMWRCKPVAAASARELLEQLELSGVRPDALIADYRLREHESGAGAIAALRARYGAALPALIMSGDTTPEIFQVAREQRLPLLSKPVRAALQHLLSGSRETARAAA